MPGFVEFSGWLGGELVETLGVSVRDGAGVDAPSSLHAGARARRPGGSMPVHREV